MAKAGEGLFKKYIPKDIHEKVRWSTLGCVRTYTFEQPRYVSLPLVSDVMCWCWRRALNLYAHT